MTTNEEKIGAEGETKLIVFASVAAFVMILLLLISFKVCRIIKCTNAWLLSVMIFLNISMFLNVAHLSMNAIFVKEDISMDSEPAQVVSKMISGLTTSSFQLGMLINVRNWIQYLIRVGEIADRKQDRNSTKRKVLIINIITCIIILLEVCWHSIYLYLYIHEKSYWVYEHIWNLYCGIYFIVLGLTFAVTEIIMIYKLRNYFPAFYD